MKTPITAKSNKNVRAIKGVLGMMGDNAQYDQIPYSQHGGAMEERWGKYSGMTIYQAIDYELAFIEPIYINQMIVRWELECANNNCNYLAVEYPEFVGAEGYQLLMRNLISFARLWIFVIQGMWFILMVICLCESIHEFLIYRT